MRCTRLARFTGCSSRVRLRLVAGFGREGITKVPSDARFRMNAAALAKSVARDLSDGVLPVAVVGFGLWFVPLKLSESMVPRFRPKLDQVATYKLGTALVNFPVWLPTAYRSLAAMCVLPGTGLRRRPCRLTRMS